MVRKGVGAQHAAGGADGEVGEAGEADLSVWVEIGLKREVKG
jgi:hypothetical protein